MIKDALAFLALILAYAGVVYLDNHAPDITLPPCIMNIIEP